ncbi:MAG: peptide ABC transporter substrate-binding protein [Vulcanimicrobiaceae bacterium]
MSRPLGIPSLLSFALAVVLASSFATGCSRRDTASRQTTSLTIVQQREPRSLDPLFENGTASKEFGELLFSYLLTWNSHGQLIPDAATQVPTLANGGISTDGLTITYHLRHDVRFSDGTPLTANDCIATIHAIMNPQSLVQSRYGYDRVARANAPNPYTLVIHLRRPFAPLLTLLFAPMGFPILPAHIIAHSGNLNEARFNDAPIGSGPYRVLQWRHGDRIELASNPEYFRGIPKIARLVIHFVPNPDVAIDQLQTHEAQFFFNDEDWSTIPQLRTLKNTTTLVTPMNGIGALIFNTQSSPTNDVRVREAVARGLNIPLLVSRSYRNAINATHPTRGLFMQTADDKAWPMLSYQPTLAARELARDGWISGPDNVRKKDERPLRMVLTIAAGTPSEAAMAAQIRQELRAIGIVVEIKAYAMTQFAAPAEAGGPVYGGKFNLALYPFVPGDDPDTTDQFACTRVPPSGYNKSRICDPKIDALLLAGRESNDPLVRANIYRKLQKRLAEQLPMLPLFQARGVNAFTSRLHGVSGSVATVFWDAYKWHYK